MKSLIILGAGGHGKVVCETALISRNFKNISFLDDKFNKNNSYKFQGMPLIGKLNYIESISCKNSFECAIVAFGDSGLRINWINKLKSYGYEIPSIIHPSAVISPSCLIKEGTVVFAQAAQHSPRKTVFHTKLPYPGRSLCAGHSSSQGKGFFGQTAWTTAGQYGAQGARVSPLPLHSTVGKADRHNSVRVSC